MPRGDRAAAASARAGRRAEGRGGPPRQGLDEGPGPSYNMVTYIMY